MLSAASLDNSCQLRRNKVAELLSYVEKRAKETGLVDVGQAVFDTNLNFVSNTLFSMDLAGGPDSKFSKEFKHLSRNIVKLMGKPNLVDSFPLLRVLDPQGIRRGITKNLKKLKILIDGLIDDRLAGTTAVPPESDADMLGVLLKLSRDHNNTGITRTFIPHVIIDLFIGGTDTISSTVEYAMAELIRNPEKIMKLREELDDIVGTTGRGNPIDESKISMLPYLQAVVRETLRLHPIVPLGMREAADTFETHGLTIPKGTRVWANLWAIGRDSSVWTNPLLFQPERHLLGSNGLGDKGTITNTNLFPFGSGRRICPGMSLALRMVPVVLGSLVHSFDWKLENGALPESLDMEEVFGITVQKAIPLCAIPVKLA